MKRVVGWLIVLGSVLLFLLFVGFRVIQAVDRRSAAAERTGAGGPPVVRTVEVSARDLSGRVEVTGTLRAANTVEVVADVPGRVEAILADVGDRVSAGQVLARLEATELRLAVAQAEGAVAAAAAGEEAARRDAESAEKLAEGKALTEVQLVGARARLAAAVGQHQQARAARDLAAERLRDSALRAPVGGLVTRASVDQGQMVAPGVPAFQIQDVSAYEVDVGFDEANAYAVVPGQPVRVKVVARGDLELPGRIQTVSSSLDRQTRKALATLRLDPTEERLITGSTVKVELALDPRSGVVTVPETAVVDLDGAPVVRVVETGNVVRNVSVRTGLRQDGQVEVDAVQAGATVVVTGPPELADGTVVEPRS